MNTDRPANDVIRVDMQERCIEPTRCRISGKCSSLIVTDFGCNVVIQAKLQQFKCGCMIQNIQRRSDLLSNRVVCAAIATTTLTDIAMQRE